MKHFSQIKQSSDPLKSFILERGTEIKIAPGATIVSQGSQSNTVYRILRGCVRVCAYSADGDRRILQFLGAGDYIGLDDVEDSITAREAVDMVVVAAIPRPVFEAQLSRSADLQLSVREQLAKEVDALAGLFILTAQTSATMRVKLFLEQFAERRSSCGFISLPMCRRDIADHLGLSMETVSRAFSALKENGKIALKGANFFKICVEPEGFVRAA